MYLNNFGNLNDIAEREIILKFVRKKFLTKVKFDRKSFRFYFDSFHWVNLNKDDFQRWFNLS